MCITICIYCYDGKVFTVAFGQFNASLQNKWNGSPFLPLNRTFKKCNFSNVKCSNFITSNCELYHTILSRYITIKSTHDSNQDFFFAKRHYTFVRNYILNVSFYYCLDKMLHISLWNWNITIIIYYYSAVKRQ